MQSLSEQSFEGFSKPEANFFRLPNEWTDITAQVTSLAEMKLVEYVLKHTWGYSEFDMVKKITTDEFMSGRKKKSGERIDIGTLLVPPLRSNDPGTFGIDVKLSGDALEVTTAAPASPASVAGIVIGDKITAIQGHTIAELTPDVAHTLVSSGSISVGQTLAVTLASGKTVNVTAAKSK